MDHVTLPSELSVIHMGNTGTLIIYCGLPYGVGQRRLGFFEKNLAYRYIRLF
ncbi:hypothetical protein L873DRAFT_1803827 [Choiromyces venosus 120613-1]|uniref:Uncharacterized protein n=1 Tax=Choiromyces venosus 120613-1 TaxID=1336337 RepID=A0A3N4JWW3_9PEZI|nr:hypothetical protein L873DRAFT_1803827 [Choiromyces venosus 120613-1]